MLQTFGNLTPEQVEQKSKCHLSPIKDIGSHLIATNGYPGAVHLSVHVDIMLSSFPENAGLDDRPYSQSKKSTITIIMVPVRFLSSSALPVLPN